MRPRPIKHLFFKVIFSIFLFICGMAEFGYSFYVLSWNENQLNLPEIVQQSIDISTLPNPINLENKLISITDRITTNALLGDGEFLTAAPYIVIDRRVEYYERDEQNRNTESSPNNSSNDRTRTPRSSPPSNRTPRTREPRSSSTNNRTQRSPQPQPKASGTWTSSNIEQPLLTVSAARIGRYRLNLAQFQTVTNRRSSCNSSAQSFSFSVPLENAALILPQGELTLTAENTQIPPNPVWRTRWDSYTQRLPKYIFKGTGTPQSPEFGDKRTCYAVLPNNALVTVFGRIEGDILTPYQARDRQILRLVPGSRAAAIDILKHQYQWAKWLSRLVGFLLTWCGLWVMCFPSSLLPGRIPWLRQMGDNSFVYCFRPAVAISIMSAVTAFFSHSVIPAITITIAMFLALAIRNWRSR
jgi:Transmembrane protein 43